MDRAHRAGTSLTHCVQHRDHFVAQDFSHNDPICVHSKCSAHEHRHPDRAGALHICFASSRAHEIRMPLDLVVEPQLESLLYCHDPFPSEGIFFEAKARTEGGFSR